MNKAKLFIGVFCILALAVISCITFNHIHKSTITLDEIVTKFNSSNPMSEHLMKTYNATEKAVLESDGIMLTMNNCPFDDDGVLNVKFVLNDNILSTSISKEIDFYSFGESMAWSLLDCIAQLNGVEKEEVYDTLRDNREIIYTLSKNGFEINNSSDSVNIKIDLNKRISVSN